jgi:hypothetical protein
MGLITMLTLAMTGAGIIAVLSSSTAYAHHAFAAKYAFKPVTLKGTLTKAANKDSSEK